MDEIHGLLPRRGFMSEKIKLTEKIIANCPAPATSNKPIVLRDSEVRGLTVHVGKGDKVYRFERCINKVRINKTIEHCDVMKLKDAREIALKLYLDFKTGKQKLLSKTIIKLYIQRFLIPHYENFTKNSKSAISIINVYLLPFFGHMTISQVTYTIVQESVHKLMESGLAPETIRKRVQCGHLLFELLIKNGLAETNPFKGVNRPPVNNIRDYVLTAEQRLPYIESLREEDSVFSDALMLQLAAVMRVSEVIAIKTVDISDDLSVLTLNDTKSNKRQYVSLNSLAKEVVKRRLPLTNNEYLFPSPKYLDSHIASPRGCFKRIKKRMELKGYDISGMWQHDQRRTGATVSSEASNGNSHLVAGLIRHSNTHILNRYIHCSNQDVAALSEATAISLLTPYKTKTP